MLIKNINNTMLKIAKRTERKAEEVAAPRQINMNYTAEYMTKKNNRELCFYSKYTTSIVKNQHLQSMFLMLLIYFYIKIVS
jgi:hypothetical protein